MKRLLLAFSLIFCVSFLHAQNEMTLRVTDVDVDGLNPGDKVYVSLYIDDVTPGANIYGWQFFIGHDQTYITWDGSFANPLPGINYLNPLFPNSAAALFNVNAGSELVYLWGDGFFLGDLTGATYPLQIIEFIFTYQGGLMPGMESPLVWGTVPGLKNNMMEKGETEVYDDWLDYFDLTLIDGIVFSPGGGPVVKEWVGGAKSSDWFDPNNWSPAGTPTISDNVLIPTGAITMPVVETNLVTPEVAVCFDIEVQLGASLIINPLGFMTVAGTFDNEGFVGILTDADYSGSLICTDIQGMGDYQYWRFLDVTMSIPDYEQRGWHYISSPTAGFGSHNMFDYYVFSWDETAHQWVDHGGMTPFCVPGLEVFNDGMYGWSVKRDEYYECDDPNMGAGPVVKFIGPYNAGTQNAQMTASNFGANPNFNLMGNPFPSWWFYDQLWFEGLPAGMFDAIYFWDESMNQYAEYVDGVSNNGGSPYVPPTQGFFFELTGAVPVVNLAVGPTQQVHIFGLDFWKESATDLVRLQVNADGRTDQATIRFNELATPERDAQYDARKLMSGMMNIYTMGADLPLAINQLPAVNSLPVYFEASTSAVYNIEAIETSSFAYVTLEDLVTGIKTDLLKDSYNFSYNVGENADRFVLHFTALGVSEFTANNVSIWSNDDKIYVQSPVAGDIIVYNIMGQEVISAKMTNGTNVIPMQESNTYFVVKVINSDFVKTGKVYIK